MYYNTYWLFFLSEFLEENQTGLPFISMGWPEHYTRFDYRVAFLSIMPALFKILRQPDRDRAALYQRSVVFRPVLDTV